MFLWLPWQLPGMNELIDWRAVRFSNGRKTRAVVPETKEKYGQNKYSVMKRKWGDSIALYARSRGFSVPSGCWHFSYLFVEQTQRKDPSNVAAGAVKLIEDGLVKGKVMDGDGWGTVNSLHYYFLKDSPPGVLLGLSETGAVARSEMVEQYKVMSHVERIKKSL